MNFASEVLSKKWGVFNHYLYYHICNPDAAQNMCVGPISWNDAVARFDAERLAYTLHRMGAQYYFITLMQGYPYMLAPNATFDSIAGTKPGEACATRDLPADLIRALGKYGIDLCLYYTGDGPHKDEKIGSRFGCLDLSGKRAHVENRIVDRPFLEKWASVAAEYADRYGDGVKAWWIDGTYADLGFTDELRGILYDGIKKVNPKAAIALNCGVEDRFYKNYSKEDFIAGEFTSIRKTPQYKYIDGALTHILAPLGYNELDSNESDGWGRDGVKHTPEFLANYIQNMRAVGGATTIDVRVYIDGSFDPEQEACLYRMGKILGK